MPAPQISISVVSHRQGQLVEQLLSDLGSLGQPNLEVLLTLNLPEALAFDPSSFGIPVRVLQNATARGFGANHNAAFREATGDYFCVANPDIRLPVNPFPLLLPLAADPSIGIAAPLVVAGTGEVEDSARRFPTISAIARKLIRRLTGLPNRPDYSCNEAFEPDWVAGMFMVFRHQVFMELGGFDEAFFLYYEDVDLCARLRLLGKRIVCEPRATVVHHARRTSHRNPKYAWWHACSIVRYFASPAYAALRRAKLV